MLITNTPDCLENYIVFSNGCYDGGVPTPTSGYYIENLEGLTIDNVAMISNELLVSATKTMQEKMYFASRIVENRLKAILNSRGIKLNTIGALYPVCSASTSTVGSSVLQKGIRVSKKWLNSSQSRIWVDTIRIKSLTSGLTTLYIYDHQFNILWSQVQSLVADYEHHFNVKKHFNSDVIYILADNTNIQPYIYNCNTNTGCTPCDNKYLNVTGYDGNAISTDGYLGACVRLDCVDTDIICQFLDRVGLAVLYQTGVQLAKEWASPNNRLNIIKTHGIEWALNMATMWENASVEALDNEIDNIIQILETDKFCYNCQPRLKMYAMLPG